MSLEVHIGFSILYRSADSVLNNAAFQILMAVAMWIESPIIDLLSTSTAFSRGPEGYRRVRHFTWLLMVWVTVVHFAFVASPLYTTVLTGMGTPAAVVATARTPLLIMTCWSALIAWRRFNQGILIRARETKFIGVGTIVRCVTIFSVGFILLKTTQLSGLMIVGIALLSSVFVETVLVHFASAPVAHTLLHSHVEPDPPSLRQIGTFHLPLALATLVSLSSPPLLSYAINHSAMPIPHLAAWQVANGVAWTLRSCTFAVPEMILSLGNAQENIRQLKTFSIRLGVILTVLLGIIVAGLDHVIFRSVFDLTPEVAQYAHESLLWTLYFPAVTVAGCYLRGRLMLDGQTAPRFYALLANIVTLGIVLVVGMQLHWSGSTTAPVALGCALCAETATQGIFWLRSSRRP